MQLLFPGTHILVSTTQLLQPICLPSTLPSLNKVTHLQLVFFTDTFSLLHICWVDEKQQPRKAINQLHFKGLSLDLSQVVLLFRCSFYEAAHTFLPTKLYMHYYAKSICPLVVFTISSYARLVMQKKCFEIVLVNSIKCFIQIWCYSISHDIHEHIFKQQLNRLVFLCVISYFYPEQ